MDKEKLAQLIKAKLDELENDFTKEFLVEYLETGMEDDLPEDIIEKLGIDLSKIEEPDLPTEVDESEATLEPAESPEVTDEDPEELFGQAQRANALEDYAGAALILQRVIELDPQHSEAQELYREVNQKVLDFTFR